MYAPSVGQSSQAKVYRQGGVSMKVELSICPICGKQYFGYPALSRTDNKTLICPDCGVAEAIAVFMNSKEDVKNEQRNKTE